MNKVDIIAPLEHGIQISKEKKNMKKRDISNEIIQGMKDAIKHVRGKKTKSKIHKVEIPDEIDVRAIRHNLKLSRTEFAAKFGFSSRTLQHWEQGDRRPHGPAKVLLLLLEREPTVIEEILASKKSFFSN